MEGGDRENILCGPRGNHWWRDEWVWMLRMKMALSGARNFSYKLVAARAFSLYSPQKSRVWPQWTCTAYTVFFREIKRCCCTRKKGRETRIKSAKKCNWIFASKSHTGRARERSCTWWRNSPPPLPKTRFNFFLLFFETAHNFSNRRIRLYISHWYCATHVCR